MSNLLCTEREYKDTYKQIKKILLDSKNRENYPSAAIVGGQPGSGKSVLSRYIQSQDPNTIIIDGDAIRAYHPHLNELEKEYGTDYPKVTQPFVNKAVEQLIGELSKEKYNLIIEGTLRDINVPLKTARELEEKDYLVELYIVATSKEQSWQSTLDRGRELEEEGKMPRYVDKEHHDKVVNSLPTTVEELANSDVFYNVIIMRRDQTILYDRDETPDLNPKDIMEMVLDGEPVKTVHEIEANRERDDNKIDLSEQINHARAEIERESFENNRGRIKSREDRDER